MSPYFYANNCSTLCELILANDETTEVIKEIFDLYISGWGEGEFYLCLVAF